VLCDSSTIDQAVIARSLSIAATPAAAAPVDLKTLERDYLSGLMEQYRGDRERVARAAGISVRTLYRKLSPPA